LVGSLGVVPGANVGDNFVIGEPGTPDLGGSSTTQQVTDAILKALGFTSQVCKYFNICKPFYT